MQRVRSSEGAESYGGNYNVKINKMKTNMVVCDKNEKVILNEASGRCK